jgi:citrate lyase subunit beta / citryl-CoA lyase
MDTPVSADIVIRSLLFCPANEPRKVAKLSLLGADAGVLDLEDAVAASEKAGARAGAGAVDDAWPPALRESESA